MSVLVTHAHNRLAYYTTRCLAKHGIKVTCASEFPLATCFFSQYCTDHFTYPSPWTRPEQFVQKITEEIEKREIEVLMPVHREGYVLAKHKEQLERNVRFPGPTYQKIIEVNDKARLIKTSARAGVRTPNTIIPKDLDEVDKAKSHLNFPILIKLRQGHGAIGLSHVEDPSRLDSTYSKILKTYNISKQEDLPILQEFKKGKIIALLMLFDHGSLMAKHSIHVIRQYLRVEHENPDATQSLYRIGRYLRWHGIISGTAILEEETGHAYLIDVNPRFNGGTSLAAISGINFPYMLYQIATDQKTEPKTEYKRGVKARWLWGDLTNIWRMKNEALANYQKREGWKHLNGVLNCQASLDFWDKDDPLPFFIIPLYYLNQYIRHGKMQPMVEKYS